MRNNLVQRKIKSRRVSSKKVLEIKEKLGLDPNCYVFLEQDIISAMQIAFEREIMHTQYCVQNKRLDLYFPKCKLGTEINNYGHVNRNFEDEQSKQLTIEEKRGCKIIRTNPDAPDFTIYRLINQVSICIEQSTIKSAKKSLIDDLSKRLLELAFKSNHSIKTKCLKWLVKKILPTF